MTFDLSSIGLAPQTQSLNSSTFRPPPLDGSLNPAELYDWHLRNNPNHPLFVFDRKDGAVQTIFWPEFVEAIYVGAKHVRDIMGWSENMVGTPVIAILAASDTISYFTTMIAIIRAGYAAFPVSPRNSAAGVADLMGKVGVKHILVGPEPSIATLAQEALKMLPESYPGRVPPTTSKMPLFEDLYGQPKVDPHGLPFEKQEASRVILYLHSSGSTSFPKPIPFTNRRFLELSLNYYFGERDVTGQIFSLHTVPMFHALGFMQMACVTATGIVVSTFEPTSPAQIPTPQSHFEAAVATNSDIIFTVPAVIEAWSRNSEHVKWLATRGGVMFGGGPLNKHIGDYLAAEGVSIFNLYGSTEAGGISTVLPRKAYEDWEYFKFAKNLTPELIPQGDGTSELVLVSQPFCKLLVVNSTIRGVSAFATSDLLVQHPSKPEYWKVHGRCDDQIMHSTGEKTNPGPLENILNLDPHIRSAVVFGRGRFQAGVLVDPTPPFAFDPSDETKLASFRNEIWPAVQKMNEFAPQHSRIFKEMILVSKPSKPFTYTGKGTARRQAVIKDYEDEISNVYSAVTVSSQGDIPLPLDLARGEALQFVRTIVETTLVNTVGDDDDIFQYGCDSLQATWIRNSLLRALREVAKVETREMTDNFVYQYPTISKLARFINSATEKSRAPSATSSPTNITRMNEMVDQYTQDLRPRATIASKADKHPSARVILLTGTTGALGSNILAELVGDPTVSRIYAFNRPRRGSTLALLEAQKRSMEERGLDPSLVPNSGKVHLIEGDLSQLDFGLPAAAMAELTSSITTIIHNAWPVDFKLCLDSFEPVIKGLRHLIDFALASQHCPMIMFASTFGVFQNVPNTSLPQTEDPIPASMAVGTGYIESKWVAEQLLARASELSGLRSITVRVGQLSGGRNGAWNPTEWFPALVQSSPALGCFPTSSKTVSWVPLHVAAKAFVDFSRAEVIENRIVHLIHPRPVSWGTIAIALSTHLSLPLVPFSEWTAKMDALASESEKQSANGMIEEATLRRVPALKLRTFLQPAMSTSETLDGTDAMGMPQLSCSRALELSKTLSSDSLEPLNANNAKAWLNYWQKRAVSPSHGQLAGSLNAISSTANI